MGADFIAVYIPSVMAVYSGNTISYDENGHGYTYLFSLPVNKKIYVREKYILSGNAGNGADHILCGSGSCGNYDCDPTKV